MTDAFWLWCHESQHRLPQPVSKIQSRFNFVETIWNGAANIGGHSLALSQIKLQCIVIKQGPITFVELKARMQALVFWKNVRCISNTRVLGSTQVGRNRIFLASPFFHNELVGLNIRHWFHVIGFLICVFNFSIMIPNVCNIHSGEKEDEISCRSFIISHKQPHDDDFTCWNDNANLGGVLFQICGEGFQKFRSVIWGKQWEME